MTIPVKDITVDRAQDTLIKLTSNSVEVASADLIFICINVFRITPLLDGANRFVHITPSMAVQLGSEPHEYVVLLRSGDITTTLGRGQLRASGAAA